MRVPFITEMYTLIPVSKGFANILNSGDGLQMLQLTLGHFTY